jgi:hypothetical protein
MLDPPAQMMRRTIRDIPDGLRFDRDALRIRVCRFGCLLMVRDDAPSPPERIPSIQWNSHVSLSIKAPSRQLRPKLGPEGNAPANCLRLWFSRIEERARGLFRYTASNCSSRAAGRSRSGASHPQRYGAMPRARRHSQLGPELRLLTADTKHRDP